MENLNEPIPKWGKEGACWTQLGYRGVVPPGALECKNNISQQYLETSNFRLLDQGHKQ